MSRSWQGGSTRQWRKVRAFVLTRDGYACQLRLDGVCTGFAEHAHHTKGRAVTGDDPRYIVAACEACNLATGEPATTGAVPDDEPIEVRPELMWDPGRLAAYPWLEPFLEVPDNASPPLYMTPPAEDAVGSYGADVIAWIEREHRIQLRWWQRLAIVRQYEHRADGSLCWRTILDSASRRSGKSVRIRGTATWRQAHADRFGERQEVVHTGSDLAVCRKVQKDAWRWARARDWTVIQANGKEAVETPDGDTWLVRAQDAVYGWDTTYGIVDESWDVKPVTVSEGLEPSLLERVDPQLHLTSTSHRLATSLMKTRIRDALTTDDGETLLILWAAGIGAVDNPGDPAVWKAASPHWTEDRRRTIAKKYAAALAGEADPEADDPDPMQGFLAQYLNVWQLRAPLPSRGESAVSEDEWAVLLADLPEGPPISAAIEAWFDAGVALALAWKIGKRVVVSVRDMPDLPSAVAAVKAAGFRRVAVVGASLTEDPALRVIRWRPGSSRTGAAVQELRRLLEGDVLRHDGSELLTTQVLAVRTVPGADGPRMVSSARADGLKAAVWAVSDARKQRPQRRLKAVASA